MRNLEHSIALISDKRDWLFGKQEHEAGMHTQVHLHEKLLS